MKTSKLLLCALSFAGCCTQHAHNRAAVPNGDFLYSFRQAPFISPRIIQDLTTSISDNGDQVVAVNVLAAQNSNRYYGEAKVQNVQGQSPFVFHETVTVESGQTNQAQFGYQYVGRTRSGAYVLSTSDWGGGSGVFNSLMLVSFEYDKGIITDWEKGVARPRQQRLLLKKLGEISLGDRWDGKLKVAGNSIFVGKDEGWFKGRSLGPQEDGL